MRFAETDEIEAKPVKAEHIIRFPLGLLGFERIKEYVLLSNPEEAPFLWLRMLEDPNLAFLVISPFIVVPDYQPDIADEDVQYLGLKRPQDALVFNIVTLRPDGSATVNLKGPLVLNRHSLVAKQVVPTNAPELEVQHPLRVNPT